MSEAYDGASDEGAIRALVEAWAAAVQRSDLDAILRHHASDMSMFDVPPPLHLDGIEAYAESWGPFFAASPQPPAFDIVKMRITAGRDVAFVVALMRCAVDEHGRGWQPLDFRLTIGLRKIDGEWTITHEHHSVPATD